jgi:hypothetical protein
MGAFTNSPRQLQLEPNSIIEVACTYYTGEKSATASIFLNGSSIASNQYSSDSTTRPSGYYPHGSSSSLTYNIDDNVAYVKFKLIDDITVDFIAKTNAPTIINKKAYWDCHITGNIEII